ncbi:hypothetical protein [Vibrio sp. R78045]|uniref:hypothetical protein n=1 Tax=Vibrio sp. R78045 TaxID=3093868 RepID=UPI0036F1A085
MQIVYGYCSEDDAANLLGHFVEQGDFIGVKRLGTIGREHIAFAALLPSPQVVPFYREGIHVVAVQEKTQSIHRLTLPTSSNARKKRFRKLNNTTLTPQNWKQHMSRNRGLKYVSDSFAS